MYSARLWFFVLVITASLCFGAAVNGDFRAPPEGHCPEWLAIAIGIAALAVCGFAWIMIYVSWVHRFVSSVQEGMDEALRDQPPPAPNQHAEP